MAKRLRVSDDQRRARLVARHHLTASAADVVEATRGVLALHSSDPATPYIAARARVAGFTTADLDKALVEDRSLWRVHAMRRTLFVVAADDAAVFDAAAGRAVATTERRRVEKWLAAEMDADDVLAFLAGLEERILEVLTTAGELRTQDLTLAVPELATQVTIGSGKWTARSALSSRLLFVMAMEGRIVRTRPTGSWRSSQYQWAVAADWFGEPRAVLDPVQGRAELARRYLASYGPATSDDLRWWTGWTVRHTTAALGDVDPVAVDLESGGEGYLLRDDLDEVVPAAPHAALLPGLDPTAMGFRDREWYLGPHAERLFDPNGNVGPTVWLDGRIVGGWGQRPDGEVVTEILEEVDASAHDRITAETESLTAWFDGLVITPRFRTPMERELSA